MSVIRGVPSGQVPKVVKSYVKEGKTKIVAIKQKSAELWTVTGTKS